MSTNTDERVQRVFKSLRVRVLWTKVASALEVLSSLSVPFHLGFLKQHCTTEQGSEMKFM